MADQFLKDPDAVDVYYVVWCDKDGTNDGSASDDGRLQGETITAAAATVSTGLTLDSETSGTVTISGVAYGINTVHSITLSGGTAGNTYTVTSRITTTGGRTLDKTFKIICSEV